MVMVLMLICGCVLEFFGKVKDKAGEMEKKMKDKDKHGKWRYLVNLMNNITKTYTR